MSGEISQVSMGARLRRIQSLGSLCSSTGQHIDGTETSSTQTARRKRSNHYSGPTCAFFRDLYSVLDPKPTRTVLISDNATTHSNKSGGCGWEQALVCPCLDDYHPLEDYFSKLFHFFDEAEHEQVELIFDNPKTTIDELEDHFPGLSSDNNKISNDDSLHSSMSLDSLSSHCIQKLRPKSYPPPRCRSTEQDIIMSPAAAALQQEEQVSSDTGTTGSKKLDDSIASLDMFKQSTESGVAASSKKFDDSIASIDISKQILAPTKNESPTSVADAFPSLPYFEFGTDEDY